MSYPAGNYMFKINNRNTRTRSEICLKLTIKITGSTKITSGFLMFSGGIKRDLRRSGIFIVNFEHI